MTNRELSEKLSNLAERIDHIAKTTVTFNKYPSTHDDMLKIVQELQTLSNEKYTTGHTSWNDLKNKTSTKSSNHFPF